MLDRIELFSSRVIVMIWIQKLGAIVIHVMKLPKMQIASTHLAVEQLIDACD